MQEAITVTLPAEIRPAVDKATQEEGISTDELVAEALREYLLFRRFRLLRERLVPAAQAQGILTDQDVFDRVS